jgi:hypothetical protein
MNKLVEKRDYPRPVYSEADNIMRAAQEDAGFDRMLKFRKGHFYSGEEEIPIGTQLTAHALGWTKCWIKFVDGNVVERKVYSMLKGEVPPIRDQLDDNNPTKWPYSEMTRGPQDPWVYQYLLPLESPDGEMYVFVTASFGGRRAVGDVCAAWGRKNVRDPSCGMPIIRLREVMMPSKRFGEVPRPHFEIIGWDGVHTPVREIDTSKIKPDDMNDEIPF